jgi:hypothetical protein
MLCLRDPDSGGTVTPGVSYGRSKHMLQRALLSKREASVKAATSVKIQSLFKTGGLQNLRFYLVKMYTTTTTTTTTTTSIVDQQGS